MSLKKANAGNAKVNSSLRAGNIQRCIGVRIAGRVLIIKISKKEVMLNKNWIPRSRSKEIFLTRDSKGIPKLKTEGIHIKCKKCELRDTCENVLYKAKGGGLFYCADNPKEKKRDG